MGFDILFNLIDNKNNNIKHQDVLSNPKERCYSYWIHQFVLYFVRYLVATIRIEGPPGTDMGKVILYARLKLATTSLFSPDLLRSDTNNLFTKKLRGKYEQHDGSR